MQRFHLSIIVTVLSSAILGCSQKEPLYDLFSGTSPLMEIREGDSVRQIAPRSIFLTIMNEQVELDREIYPAEIVAKDEQQIRFSATIPLGPDLTVTNMTYRKSDETLMMETARPAGEIILEPFDNMIRRKVREFAAVDLTADITHLTGNQRELLGLLFQVSEIMDEIYWEQVFADKETALDNMVNEDVIRFFRINYGPWERLNGNLPFLPGYGLKPPGSGFYPSDMKKSEFESLEDDEKRSLYTLISRNSEGDLEVIPYHEAYAEKVEKAALLLRQAAGLAEDKGFGKYLELRADALLDDNYYPSDLAWMDMKNNDIDFVVGPIENYEDALFNYKAAHEAFILIKDMQWSEKLNHISSLLPEMQRKLPVSEEYKMEVPGNDSDLGVYDVVYYAGDCNAGSKTIAINLPNDERVHAEKGSRKLQLKNAIRYKFEEILVPISNVLIAEDQREHVTFDSFFENIMFHEVAHGLGINQTINGKGTVRAALKEHYSAIEEGKADILGLHLVTQMNEMGLMGNKNLMDNYVTFMASIFRSIRFGVASSHGKANMIRFYYFQETGAFTRDPVTGTYSINFNEMQNAMNNLANKILTIQGNGDYGAAGQLVEQKGFIREELQADLDRLEEMRIPVDLVFNQGPGMLGLE